ncbi:DUF6913 domain-containing protein [Flavobacterium pedocola]
MFLKLIKDFFVKKSIKKSLSDYKLEVFDEKIQNIGLLVDETYFAKEKELVAAIVKNGIPESNIEILIYKDKIKKKEVFENPAFSRKDISLTGDIISLEVVGFMAKPFDMLVSYNDIEKPVLSLVTIQSKAKFKVGFSTIDKRLNNFMIGTVAENHKEFVEELFKYLKILNKI